MRGTADAKAHAMPNVQCVRNHTYAAPPTQRPKHIVVNGYDKQRLHWM